MKRIFYSVGLFFAVFFLSCGFFLSYQISSLRDRMNQLERESALVGKQVSANPFSRDSDYIFESYDRESGQVEKKRYRIASYANSQVILREETESDSETSSGYRICVEDGCLVVYLLEDGQVFEYTDIPLEALPGEEQAEVLAGKEIHDTHELYSFLENYSS